MEQDKAEFRDIRNKISIKTNKAHSAYDIGNNTSQKKIIYVPPDRFRHWEWLQEMLHDSI